MGLRCDLPRGTSLLVVLMSVQRAAAALPPGREHSAYSPPGTGTEV